MDYTEKRDFQRMPMESQLEYSIADTGQAKQATMVNLSAKGILFIAEEPIAEGTEVLLKVIPTNNITPPMIADAKVVRCIEQSETSYEIATEISSIHN